ncbi:adenylate kinase family protein [Candidatus Solirubrobacter pratensis]|uniref:adenylate kinase family protein n=1 Tax=Candidatus Solirubrobacter pratensis TaxID=1298857 RepID=UPI0005695DAD|nr:nucleoside monophosphate kinase [Candidatus Solirubrobacter pratensis]
MKVLMLGAPGSGKGTQGARLARELGVDHISSGDLLREAVAEDTPLGREVASHMDAGRLAPDELVTEAVLPVLGHHDGYVLDGFPRTLPQARQVDFDAVVHLDVPETELVRRLLGRGREDDREDVIAERLREYQRDTRPLVDHYRDVLVEVDGNRPEDEIAAELRERVHDA